MRKKKRNITVAFAVSMIALLAVLVYMGLKQKEDQDMFSEDCVYAKELPALLSFTYYDTEEWSKRLKDIVQNKVTYKELESLLEQLGVSGYVTYEEESGWKKVPRDIFFQVYDQIVDLLDVKKQVKTKDLLFLGEEAKEDTWLTQKGYLKFRGSTGFVHQYDMYQTVMIGGEISGLRQASKSSITWKNVFIHKGADEKAEILFEKEMLDLKVPGLTETITDTICDLEWTGGKITAILKKEDRISGTVLSYNKKKIEISGYGTLKHSGSLKVYKTYGTVEQLDESKLVIGNLVADFVVAEKKVCGIILKEPATVETIRVLILNEGTPYYPEVYVTMDEEFTAEINDKIKKIPANTMIKASDFWKKKQEGFLKIKGSSDQGNICLVDENQNPISLGYQGSFEIRKYEEGFGVVNELSLEDYLCAVVPSEMPASYETEALRAQAVCARSYACIQLARGEYANFGANVDDSTNYQVYNKQARDEKTNLAVRDTIGEVIKYNGQIAEAYYYSTSGGYTQDMGVWNLEKDGTYDYLTSVSLLKKEQKLDFTNEDVFSEFIQNKEIEAYDSEAAYFRWRAELNLNDRLESINNAAEERKAVNAGNVQVFDAEGNPADLSLSSLGRIEKLQAEERCSGGVLNKLRICYEKGSVLLATEYNIRKVLGAAATSLTDKKDSPIQSQSLLPSACFTAIPVEQGYVLYGGGYGHGIGLSQNGANGMAKEGYTYTDILQKFYQNITIENIYGQKETK